MTVAESLPSHDEVAQHPKTHPVSFTSAFICNFLCLKLVFCLQTATKMKMPAGCLGYHVQLHSDSWTALKQTHQGLFFFWDAKVTESSKHCAVGAYEQHPKKTFKLLHGHTNTLW